MDLLKIIAKSAGTAVLATAGAAAHVIDVVAEGLSSSATPIEEDATEESYEDSSVEDTADDDAPNSGSSFSLASIEDGSFDLIRKMWNPEKYEQDLENGNADIRALKREISRKHNAMFVNRRMADMMKKVQNKALETDNESAVDNAESSLEQLEAKYAELRDNLEELKENLDNL